MAGPDLLPDGFIRSETVLVLTDAVYFKARWETVFGKYGTVTDTFTRLDGSTTTVEFMRELELADRRGTGEGFVGAEIPYVSRPVGTSQGQTRSCGTDRPSRCGS